MESRLTVFLAFTCAAFAMNTLLIWLVYRSLATVTSRVTTSMVEFQRKGTTRDFIASLKTAAEQAAGVTDAARRRMAEFGPEFGQAQQRYTQAVADADTKLEKAAETISAGAQKMRDVIAKPAFELMKVGEGLGNAMRRWEAENARRNNRQ